MNLKKSYETLSDRSEGIISSIPPYYEEFNSIWLISVRLVVTEIQGGRGRTDKVTSAPDTGSDSCLRLFGLRGVQRCISYICPT